MRRSKRKIGAKSKLETLHIFLSHNSHTHSHDKPWKVQFKQTSGETSSDIQIFPGSSTIASNSVNHIDGLSIGFSTSLFVRRSFFESQSIASAAYFIVLFLLRRGNTLHTLAHTHLKKSYFRFVEKLSFLTTITLLAKMKDKKVEPSQCGSMI